ncbi:MAG: hypothetical protein SGI88_03570 [Candidatus Hydrogenedentes bacterium]|nr:hypothetical protein [Candidatus Hydrogenedentota bacterium]
MATSDSNEHLKDVLTRITPAKGESVEGEDLGPCASRPSPKWWAGLHVHNGTEPTRSFQYVQLDFAEYTPSRFTFIFAGTRQWKLEVSGRNLWSIYNYINSHRIEWIRKADRDFSGEQEPIITGITIEDVTPGD